MTLNFSMPMINTSDNIPDVHSVVPIFNYLDEVISWRLENELNGVTPPIPLLDLDNNRTPLANFIMKHQLFYSEITILLLALIPKIDPQFIGNVISKYFPEGNEFPEIGGVKGRSSKSILPTFETCVYILYGNDIDKRLKGINDLRRKSTLFKDNIIWLETLTNGEPEISARISINEEYLGMITTGLEYRPQLSQQFLASLIETDLDWEDLILNPKTLNEIKEIETWLNHNNDLMEDWNMKGKIKPGCRVLFYGPPGTGKTLSAGLLGKYSNKNVYRVDLAMIVSKYIGETEKNLTKLFDKATSKNWILFFDEADSLFGKRTNVRDKHYKYSDQEVSYLLQRIEAHPGLVILTSNSKSDIDPAFFGRFHSMVEFELPAFKERIRLWENSLPMNIALDEKVSVSDLAERYEITGSNIANAVHHAALKTMAGKHEFIPQEYVVEGIKKEYSKEGRSINF